MPDRPCLSVDTPFAVGRQGGCMIKASAPVVAPGHDRLLGRIAPEASRRAGSDEWRSRPAQRDVGRCRGLAVRRLSRSFSRSQTDAGSRPPLRRHHRHRRLSHDRLRARRSSARGLSSASSRLPSPRPSRSSAQSSAQRPRARSESPPDCRSARHCSASAAGGHYRPPRPPDRSVAAAGATGAPGDGFRAGCAADACAGCNGDRPPRGPPAPALHSRHAPHASTSPDTSRRCGRAARCRHWSRPMTGASTSSSSAAPGTARRR